MIRSPDDAVRNFHRTYLRTFNTPLQSVCYYCCCYIAVDDAERQWDCANGVGDGVSEILQHFNRLLPVQLLCE